MTLIHKLSSWPFAIFCLIAGLAAISVPMTVQGQTTDFQAINPSTLPPGRFVSISGQMAMDSTGAIIGVGNFLAQCKQVYKNLQRALHNVGLTFANVIRTDMYVTTLDHLSALRKCRTHYLPAKNPPTATLVKVESLFNPKLMIEVAVTAVIPNKTTSD